MPKRYWSISLVLVGLLLGIVGLNLLHAHAPKWINVIGTEGVDALSLDGQHGIAGWYSSFLLLLSSCVSLQLYLLRQHRRDDYRGSYRVWLWVAGICLLASMASVSGFSRLLEQSVCYFIQAEPGSGLTLIVIGKLVCLALLATRGVFEMRHSAAALAGLILVICAYAAATLIDLPQVQSEVANYVQAAHGNLLLVGASVLLATFTIYARQVYLEANGLIEVAAQSKNSTKVTTKKLDGKRIKRRQESTDGLANVPAAKSESKKQRTEQSDADSDQQETQRQEKPRKSKPDRKSSEQNSKQSQRDKATSRKQKKKSDQQNQPASTEDADEMAGLSKSERRRLRKLKRRQAA